MKAEKIVIGSIALLTLIVTILIVFNSIDIEKDIDRALNDKELLLDSSNVIDVYIQDQTSKSFDNVLARANSSPYFLLSDTVIDTYNFTLTSVVGLTVGDEFGLFQDSTKPASFFATITAINGNVVSFNAPLDIIYSNDYNAVLFVLDKNLSDDGSTNRVIYSIDNQASVSLDITRILFKIITNTQPDMGTFGDLPQLSNGLVVRKKNNDGTYYNLFTIDDNADFSLLAYDVDFYDATKKGVYGIGVRLTFGGASKHGVTIRLDEDESLEAVIQDDLTGLVDFKIMVEGHYVED